MILKFRVPIFNILDFIPGFVLKMVFTGESYPVSLFVTFSLVNLLDFLIITKSIFPEITLKGQLEEDRKIVKMRSFVACLSCHVFPDYILSPDFTMMITILIHKDSR